MYLKPIIASSISMGVAFTHIPILGVPYKSIFVSPILPLVNPSNEKIRGFICVDAEDPDMFRAEDDDSLDIVFHEYISGVIYKMIEIQEQIKD